MSDSDLRKILRDVIDEVDDGRLKLWRPIQAVRRLALPAVLAASIGGAACNSEPVGTPQDARPDFPTQEQAVDQIEGARRGLARPGP